MSEPAPERTPLVQLTLARVRELVRRAGGDLLGLRLSHPPRRVLGLAFRSRPPEPLPVAVVEGVAAEAAWPPCRRNPDLEPQPLSADEARLRSGAGAWSW